MPLFAVALLCVTPAQQDPAAFQVDFDLQASINIAIERGVDALLAQQELDGSWRASQPVYVCGMTALALYALMKSGLDNDHPAVRNGYHFLRKHPPMRTYEVACAVLVESAMGDQLDEDWLQHLTDQLLGWQLNNGFGYPQAPSDLSNTQYAALAMHVAAEHGAKVPDKAWKRLGEAGLGFQEELEDKRAVTGSSSPVGFRYRPGNSTATGSMTAAGVTVLQVAYLHSKGRRSQLMAARDQGVAWLGHHFMVTANPSPAQGEAGTSGSHFYFLYGMERVAGLMSLVEIGGNPWYPEGARYLLTRQEGNGRWLNGQAQTCFALLFLSRATVGGLAATGGGADAASTRRRYSYGDDNPARDLSVRASGREQITMWLSSIGDRVKKRDVWLGDDGPRVGAARFRLERLHSAQPMIQMIEIPVGQVGETLSGRRFAWKGSFDAPGVWRIQMELDIVPPRGKIADQDTWVRLHSSALEVPFQPCWMERTAQYSPAEEVNLLASQTIQMQSTSDWKDNWSAKFACDQLQGTGWLSADDDPLPRIILLWEDAVRVDTLVLSHSHNFAYPDASRRARIKKLRYKLNGSKRWTEADMDTNEWVKTAIDFGKVQKVRSVEIEVLEVAPGNDGLGAVGFNEIELERRN